MNVNCRKSLKDLFPPHFLSSRIVLALIEKYEMKFSAISLETVIVLFFSTRHFETEQFLPRGVYSGWGIVVTVLVRTSVRTYVRTYVRPKFFLRFLFFWDPHVGSS